MISGFTFVRNGVKFDYPFLESISSLLPLVDELVVLVGVGEDSTLERIQNLAASEPKLKIFESEWDAALMKGGAILAQQTNLAMEKCQGEWGIYLQADEVLHEEDHDKIRKAIESASSEVEGVVFSYVHFYGDFFVINRNPSAYRREVRAVRLKPGLTSWKDAQGFRIKENDGFRKLKVVSTEARIFHYGWVRPPEVMRQKTVAMDKLYHGEKGGTGDNYRYKRILGLEAFRATHPQWMLKRVEGKNWSVELLNAPLVFHWKDVRKLFSLWIERLTGWLPGEYRNYRF